MQHLSPEALSPKYVLCQAQREQEAMMDAAEIFHHVPRTRFCFGVYKQYIEQPRLSRNR